MKKEFYFCTQCKKHIEGLDELYFVEDESPRGFCSESCIEKFYAPMITYYSEQEVKLRKQYQLENENCMDSINNPKYMERVLTSPDEIWCKKNAVGEKIYSFISSFKDDDGEFYIAVLLLIYNWTPAFIILPSASRSSRYIREFQIGNRVEDISKFKLAREKSGGSVIQLSKETIESIENKKSSMLALLLEHRSPSDITYENFHLYLDYYQPTLEKPDEIYLSTDEMGDQIFTYIKSFDSGGISFYYYVLCVEYVSDAERNAKTLLPILSFPSVDGNVYKQFQKGTLISGGLKN